MVTLLARRSMVAAAGAFVILLASAPPARAHAALVSSSPEAGAEVANAPGVVTLTFSEPLISELSRATVTAPDGQQFEGGASARREIRVSLQTTTPGVYEVNWKTVSPVDGHTLRGNFRFGVGVDPGPGSAGTTGTGPRNVDLLVALARFVEYASLLFAVGSLVLSALSRRAPPLAWARPPLRAPLAFALVAGIAVVLGEAAVAAPSPTLRALVDYFATSQGVARLTRLGVEALALAAAFRSRALAVPLLAGTLVALAAAGHAAAATPPWWAVASDALHLAAAGVWAGAILALATVRPPGGWRTPEARELLARFSPVAIAGFAATVLFGVVRSTQELAALDDLVSSAYGRLLGAKILLVAVMVPLSLLAWARRTRSHRREATVALSIALAAALLAAFPLPPRRVAEADAAAHPEAGGSELPQAGDLTLGASAGDTLVAVTVRPGTPGRNRVLATLVPPSGAADEPPPADLAVAGQRLGLESCGPTCRSTTVTLQGGEQLDLHVDGPTGGSATFALPRLPAPDATSLLDRFSRRMDALDTYRLEEVFRPANPPIRSRWTIVAPDRLHIDFATGAETVRISSTTYSHEPGQPWERSQGPQLKVPSHIWDVPERRAAHIVGTEPVDGVTTQILSFVASTSTEGGSPIWYRLWVDDSGLVRRGEMRTEGHFMDHHYLDFDAPLTVEPPQ
ncbi:MAG: copper resistance protein CopC [Acidimicrobiia bacterium]